MSLIVFEQHHARAVIPPTYTRPHLGVARTPVVIRVRQYVNGCTLTLAAYTERLNVERSRRTLVPLVSLSKLVVLPVFMLFDRMCSL